jgi:type VI secretion system protein ImpJ
MKKIPQLMKISSHDGLDRLIRQALPGVGLTHVPNPPSAVPIKRSHQYFLLTQSGPEWEAIARARNLSAYVSAELPDPQLELVLILPPE